jgi:hypothetical protein
LGVFILKSNTKCFGRVYPDAGRAQVDRAPENGGHCEGGFATEAIPFTAWGIAAKSDSFIFYGNESRQPGGGTEMPKQVRHDLVLWLSGTNKSEGHAELVSASKKSLFIARSALRPRQSSVWYFIAQIPGR